MGITPDIHPVAPPELMAPADAEDVNHEDLSKGGLYTAKEEESWERLTSFPSYHEALVKSVTVESVFRKALVSRDSPRVSDSLT